MDEKLEFYKEQYYYELNRKSSISNAMSIPMGFLTALFSGYAYLCLNLHYFTNFVSIVVFGLFMTISCIFAMLSIIYLFTSLKGLSYGYVPQTKDLFKYEQQCKEYCLKNKIDPSFIDKKFFDGLKVSIVNTTTNNRNNNNFRADKMKSS